MQEQNQLPIGTTFSMGDRVRKRSGSEWQGLIVGWYSTKLTPEGYAVESEVHRGSVQIYPAAALEKV
jgi:dihydrofolate reductase (trimethoprim resistance protein)